MLGSRPAQLCSQQATAGLRTLWRPERLERSSSYTPSRRWGAQWVLRPPPAPARFSGERRGVPETPWLLSDRANPSSRTRVPGV